MRRGRTTGSCAAAAVKAALLKLEFARESESVDIPLPDGQHFLSVPVHLVRQVDHKSAYAEVIKFAGDDPDNTDGAVITVLLTRRADFQIHFLAGRGVGVVTAGGLQIPVGEPAINPTPRAMIRELIEDVFGQERVYGYDIQIGCVNGEVIAQKTFNPRLGILGGISILGTTGIVEPMSLAAYVAAIEVYIRVALAVNGTQVAFLPGNVGLGFATSTLGLSRKEIVHISNFLGYSLDFTQAYLEEKDEYLDRLWLLGHPGKLAKALNNDWDTHSSKSAMAMESLAAFAGQLGYDAGLVQKMAQANTVEEVIGLLSACSNSQVSALSFWQAVEEKLALLMRERLKRVGEVKVRLFSMKGEALAQA
jgi:cobalt-precorrin-5B (C1)-methyltransferase